MKHLLLVSALAVSLGLAACSGKTSAPDVNPTPEGIKEGPGLFSGQSGNLTDVFKRDGGSKGASALPVNAFLWRSSLESIGFMPLSVVDSQGGVITTDWANNGSMTDEQIKVNILILGLALSPDSLKVTMFKRVKQEDGTWKEVPASSQAEAALEDTILTAARRLRIRETAAY